MLVLGLRPSAAGHEGATEGRGAKFKVKSDPSAEAAARGRPWEDRWEVGRVTAVVGSGTVTAHGREELATGESARSGRGRQLDLGCDGQGAKRAGRSFIYSFIQFLSAWLMPTTGGRGEAIGVYDGAGGGAHSRSKLPLDGRGTTGCSVASAVPPTDDLDLRGCASGRGNSQGAGPEAADQGLLSERRSQEARVAGAEQAWTEGQRVGPGGHWGTVDLARASGSMEGFGGIGML